MRFIDFFKKKNTQKNKPQDIKKNSQNTQLIKRIVGDDDFFFEDGAQTPFLRVRMTGDAVIMYYQRLQLLKKQGEIDDSKSRFYLISQITNDVENARHNLPEGYNPRDAIEFMGGSLPSPQKSEYKYTVEVVIGGLTPLPTGELENN